jgi:hypothetical protein
VKFIVYNRVRQHRGEPSKLEADESENLIVRVTRPDGSVFEIGDDYSSGDLSVREVDGRTISISPVGANAIRIRAEPHS